MSDQSPQISAPPQCSKCHASMLFAMTIPRVSEPGRVCIFECATCGKLDFRPERDHAAAGERF
jgi:hypothetical protein